MFENPRRGRQARNFTTNVPKILDLKSSSEQIFYEKLTLGAPAARFENNYNFQNAMFWEEKLGKINARDVNDLTFEYYWKQLQLRVWRYVMSIE